MNQKRKKPCHAGEAYICTRWTEEKEWWKRHKQDYCWKCGKPIEYNFNTYRWVHCK